MGKPGMAGAHTNQRLSLSKPWEGLRRTCRGFEPDSGNLTVRDYRGASRNVRHGEIVTPSRNRKSGNGNPFTYSGARSNSIPTAKRARKAETPKQPSLYLKCCARRTSIPTLGESAPAASVIGLVPGVLMPRDLVPLDGEYNIHRGADPSGDAAECSGQSNAAWRGASQAPKRSRSFDPGDVKGSCVVEPREIWLDPSSADAIRELNVQ